MLKALCGKIKRLSFFSCWLYFCFIGSVFPGIIEIVEEQACESHEFRLTCRKLDSHIAILEAWFTRTNLTGEEEALGGANLTQCAALRFQDSYLSTRLSESDYEKHVVLDRNESENLRGPISHRCTGVNHCSFILPHDHKPAAAWGSGSIYLKYACVDDSRSVRFCNREVWAGGGRPAEGFVRSPGYPHYYVGESRCHWALRAPRGQRLRLTLIDVDLRNVGPWEEGCTDELVVQDVATGEELLSSCEQVEMPLVLESRADALDVLVKADSEYAYPKRGVLFHYKTLGCITPAAPSDGYLVYREAMAAHYMCCVRFMFADTRQRARTITCLNDNTWNETLPEKCIEDPLASSGTVKAFDTSRSDSADMLVDIVIPSLLIAALFIGNAFIVLIIYKYRKRKEDDQDDEFNTIPLSPNGYASSMANAV